MPPQFDDTAYQEGRKMFRKKATLRSMLEPIVNSARLSRDNKDDGRPFKKPSKEEEYKANQDWEQANENASFSKLIGFADEFLNNVRR